MESSKHKTTCSYCGVGCGIIIGKDAQGKLSVSGDPDHPVNRGMLCSKGMNLHYVAQDFSDRILYPEMRGNKHHPRQRVSWDTALTRAAAVFHSLIRQHGPDSVGFYVSGQCLTEEYYLVNKLVKGFIGTNNIDTNSRLCMSSAVAGYSQTLGEDAVPISYDDIELADCFFIAGANPAWCHPILFRRIEQHKANHPEVKIIVADPRRTQSCAIADLHLQLKPGTDILLYHAIARCLIEMGYIDREFIQNHTDGYDVFRAAVMRLSLEEAASACALPKGDILLAARMIGQSRAFLSMWAMGLNQSVIGVGKNLALLNLSLITGQIGKPGAGPFSLTGQPNAMGGREVGGMATLLAAHRDPANPAHRQEVADFWKVNALPDRPGLTATQMFDALREDRLKAIWIICTNPLVSLPDAHLVEQALQQARFVVVQDISHRADTAQYADLLLPAAGFMEKEGTMTNSDRRVSYLPKILDPPGEALPDAEILCRFAQKMGYAGFDYGRIAEVYDEHCRLTRGTRIDIGGLSHERLQNEGTFQWPVPSALHKGTPRLFADKKFYTPNGRAQIRAPQQVENPSAPTSPEFPLILTTGRIRDQWHTMTRTGKVNKLRDHIDRPFLEIHPHDAQARNIKAGDITLIRNERGEVRVTARVTEDIKPGVVFLPMHWGKVLNKDFSRANNLTHNRCDPVSKEPDFKFSAVAVQLYQKPRQKIAVVGAGTAAYSFIKAYRMYNQEDEIHVFSRESHPFYNRILLPDYISERLSWEQLEKAQPREIADWNIHLHCGVGIDRISPTDKKIWDQNGSEYDYDLMILATGSRAFVPPGFPGHLPQVHTLRCKADADRLKRQLSEKDPSHVVIAGGGILGLELAGALREIGTAVSVIQRASRLMERQLDGPSGRILLEEIRDRGIDVYFDNEIETVFDEKSEGRLQVTLRSGKILNCDSVVYAIGTKPNIELAKSAGLHCGRGVTVDAHLQTSDPNVFALGEIAEFEQKCYGIASAAEEQAEIAARYIAGDLFSAYSGPVLMGLLKFPGLSLCTLGQVFMPTHDDSYEEVLVLDQRKHYYKKCIIHNDRLVGAILMGEQDEFAGFKSLIQNQTELAEKRDQLLRGAPAREPVIGKLVCACNQVGEGNIRKKIAEGCTRLKDLCAATGAGLGCGSCKSEVNALLEESLETA